MDYNPEHHSTHVVKLGGSLLELPDLIRRLRRWSDRQAYTRTLLIVGGGRAADTVRLFDRRDQLDEEAGHWLAVRAMSFNAHLVASVLPGCEVVGDLEACRGVWDCGLIAVPDSYCWLRGEEDRGIAVPHVWGLTSDSIAAHLAMRVGASCLTLLKSTLPAGPVGVTGAIDAGLIDACFESASKGVCSIKVVNLRESPPRECVLKSLSPASAPGHGQRG